MILFAQLRGLWLLLFDHTLPLSLSFVALHLFTPHRRA